MSKKIKQNFLKNAARSCQSPPPMAIKALAKIISIKKNLTIFIPTGTPLTRTYASNTNKIYESAKSTKKLSKFTRKFIKFKSFNLPPFTKITIFCRVCNLQKMLLIKFYLPFKFNQIVPVHRGWFRILGLILHAHS